MISFFHPALLLIALAVGNTSNRMSENNTIIVVGGGISGLALALGLANDGFKVQVVEKDVRKRTGSAFCLQPNGLKALREIHDCPWTFLDKGITMPSGGKLLVWWVVRDALLEQVRKQPDKITVHTGWSFSSLEQDDSSVTVKCVKTKCDGDETETMQLRGALMVAADGVHSTVRRALQLPAAQSAGTLSWRGSIIVDDHATLSSKDNANQVLSPLLLQGIKPLGFVKCGPSVLGVTNFHEKDPGVMTWSVSTQLDQLPASSPLTHPLQVLEPHLTDDAKTLSIVRAIFELAPSDELQLSFEIKTVEPPSQDGQGWGGVGRVTIIGDAAHAMRPGGGLGGSIALEDVVVLKRLLKQYNKDLTDKVVAHQLLRGFENSRLPRVRKIFFDQKAKVELTYKQGYSFKDAVPDPEFMEWIYQGV
jgi:2-polyprenyl-6-methoxyphenol hydroxylase-like FAD-dependent oxidoreductase